MTTETLINAAYEAIESDKRLQNSDKLVLLHWAWKYRFETPAEAIRYKPYARELSLTVNTIKASVKRLIEFGYIAENGTIGKAFNAATTTTTGQ